MEKNCRLNVNSVPGAVPRLPDPKIIPTLRKTLCLRDGLTRISNFRICHSRISSSRTATHNTPIHHFRTAIRGVMDSLRSQITRTSRTRISNFRIIIREMLLSQMPRHAEPATLPMKLYILPDGQNALRSFLCSLLAYSRFWLCSMSCS